MGMDGTAGSHTWSDSASSGSGVMPCLIAPLGTGSNIALKTGSWSAVDSYCRFSQGDGLWLGSRLRVV